MRESLRLAAFATTLSLLLSACSGTEAPAASEAETAAQPGNPAAAGFNLEGSDARAIELADRTMAAMGGRQAWDDTRFITWRFFFPPPDGRLLIWDKWNGDVRIEQGEDLTLINIHSGAGRAFKAGVEVTEMEALAEALKAGYETWVNDSYWLVMPYKLKDSGVTLTHLGDGTTDAGGEAEVVQLTFEGVGVTPQNKYHVWVGKESGLVEQWAFFAEGSQEEAAFTLPWNQWAQHGQILLSGDRGARHLTEIAVSDSLPESVFNSPAPLSGASE